MILALLVLLAQVDAPESHDLCTVVKSVVRTSVDGFRASKGAKHDDKAKLTAWTAPVKLPGATGCKVVEYKDGSAPFYGCLMHATSCKLTEAKFLALVKDLSTCPQAPPKLDDAPPVIPFTELFTRRPIMRRMEHAFQFMKAGINNEAAFKKEAERVKREAVVLAVLTKIAGAEGYGSADEEDYQKFVKAMVDGGLAIVAAVKDENFAAYTDALGKCQKSCDECHLNYKMSQ